MTEFHIPVTHYQWWARFLYEASFARRVIIPHLLGHVLSIPRAAALGRAIVAAPALLAFYSFIWIH